MKTKRLSAVVLCLLALLLLAGCADFEYLLQINEDGSADVTYHYAVNGALLALVDQPNSTKAAKEKAQQEGYQVRDYIIEDRTGFQAQKHFDSVKDISLTPVNVLLNGREDSSSGLGVSKGFFKSRYSLQTSIDLSFMKRSGENAEFLNSYLSEIQFKLIIKLPVKAGENNASKISSDGKTLEWLLQAGENNEIGFEATAPGRINFLPLFIGCGVVVLLIGGGVVLLVVRKKKRKNKQNKKEKEGAGKLLKAGEERSERKSKAKPEKQPKTQRTKKAKPAKRKKTKEKENQSNTEEPI